VQIKVITSFNQEYYDKIGRDCLSSFLRHWSTDITVYNEGATVMSDDRVQLVGFDQLPEDYNLLQQNQSQSDRVKRFAKKAYSFIHAMYHSPSCWLIWLDADVITQKRDPVALLRNLLKPNHLAMYMGVRYDSHRDLKFGDWLVPETGLFGVNTDHDRFAEFRQRYHRRYRELDFADLRRSYDNDVFGAVVNEISASYLDLCQGLPKAYKTPLRHTVFGDYLHHYKAKHSKADYAAAQ